MIEKKLYVGDKPLNKLSKKELIEEIEQLFGALENMRSQQKQLITQIMMQNNQLKKLDQMKEEMNHGQATPG